jgi:hypothetical protein
MNPQWDIRTLALALHEWEGSAVAGELNCYTCAQWPDDNTPDYQPKPGDMCWDGAEVIAQEYGRLWNERHETAGRLTDG